ncbi:MAG: MBL fold metallo-hydrolase [Ruminococcus sp.]|nr:MBL fold metallo-hydrolase [Ruminococcus sp.]
MKIHVLQLGTLGANCYIIETAPAQCVAVDIGGSAERFLEFLRSKKLTLNKILLTHGHFDHMGGVEAVRAATGAEVYIHADDAHKLENAESSLATHIPGERFTAVKEYISTIGDSFINDGKLCFKVMHTPGHSAGSVCYICDDVIFSGDTLFRLSMGRTDFYDGSNGAMHNSLLRLSMLNGNYTVYPGHGEETTLDFERNNNPYMQRL